MHKSCYDVDLFKSYVQYKRVDFAGGLSMSNSVGAELTQ